MSHLDCRDGIPRGYTWDSPDCIDSTRRAEQEPGDVHRNHSCGAGRDEWGPCSSSSCGASPWGHSACVSLADHLLVLPLLFPPLLEFLSLKAVSHGLGSNRELSLGCCRIWRNWDVAEKGRVTSHRNAVTVWTGGKGSRANSPPKCRMEALPHDCSAQLDSPESLRLREDALDYSLLHG